MAEAMTIKDDYDERNRPNIPVIGEPIMLSSIDAAMLISFIATHTKNKEAWMLDVLHYGSEKFR
jgi:hypothetical protein